MRARVLRGGTWNNNRNNARCAIRNRNNPDNFNNNVGFRLVLSHNIFPLPEVPHRPRTAVEANISAGLLPARDFISGKYTTCPPPGFVPEVGDLFLDSHISLSYNPSHSEVVRENT